MSSELNWCVRLIFMWPAAIHSLTPEVCSTDGKKVEQTAKKGKGKTTTWMNESTREIGGWLRWIGGSACPSFLEFRLSSGCVNTLAYDNVLLDVDVQVINTRFLQPSSPFMSLYHIGPGDSSIIPFPMEIVNIFRTEQATHKLGPNFWWNNIRRVFVTS